MGAERLRWRSARQQERLLASLLRPLEQWQREWSVAASPFGLEAAVTPAVDGPVHEWLWASSSRGSAWLCVPGDGMSAVGRVLLSVDGNDPLGISGAVGRRAMRALLANWCHALPSEIAASSPPKPGQAAPRSGAASFSVMWAVAPVWLVLDGELADHWLQVTPGAGETLQPRASALSASNVACQVALPLGQTRLEAAHGLRVGDVLVSSAPLNTCFELLVADAAPLAIGGLCRRRNHRALVLEGAKKKTNP